MTRVGNAEAFVEAKLDKESTIAVMQKLQGALDRAKNPEVRVKLAPPKALSTEVAEVIKKVQSAIDRARKPVVHVKVDLDNTSVAALKAKIKGLGDKASVKVEAKTAEASR